MEIDNVIMLLVEIAGR